MDSKFNIWLDIEADPIGFSSLMSVSLMEQEMDIGSVVLPGLSTNVVMDSFLHCFFKYVLFGTCYEKTSH